MKGSPREKGKEVWGEETQVQKTKIFSKKLPWHGSNMLNMRSYGRTCDSTSSWRLGVGAKL